MRMLGRGLYRCAGLVLQLHRLLVHAQHRVLLVVQPGIGFRDPFHGRCELGVGFRRDDPVLELAPANAVLLAFARRFRG